MPHTLRPADNRGRPGATGIGPGRDWRFWALLALFTLLLGLHLVTPRLDSDQAVTGLMGVHILEGKFPIFFWGQDHAGVPESYGAAVTFFLFGVSRTALSLVPALAALGLVLLLYRTGCVLFGAGAGLLAMLFATVVSPYMVAHYVRARAYYIEHLLLGQVVLLGAALWLQKGAALTEPARCRALIAMGLAGGVGLYCGFQIVDMLLPAVLAVLLVDPALPVRRGAWLGLGAFLIGSLPFWLYNVTHGWATFATGVKFQGRWGAGEALRILFVEILPVVLGVQDYIGTPPYLPRRVALVIPAVTAAATVLLLLRVARGAARLRRDPALAGEALLLADLAATLGAVWYGRFLSVPRYLVYVVPPLALVLARACQLVWRRTPAGAVVGASAYLLVVGIPLAGDIITLGTDSRQAYWAARAEDERLFTFLRARGLTLAYTSEYWVGPRLTFDAAETVIVAEPFNARYPPHTRAVDASPRPAYVVRTDVERFERWVQGIGSRAERADIGQYTVFWNFSPPAPVAPLPRARWTARTSAGVGAPAGLLDGRLETGWSSAPGPTGSAWVEIDLAEVRPIAGVTLITDQPQRVPQILEVAVADGTAADSRPLARFETGGFTVAWRNGAPRTLPGRTLTVRFGPVEARRLRLSDAGPAGSWAVAELFLLTPTASPTPVPEAIAAGRQLEAEGRLGPALVGYRDAMRAAPDDPTGYGEFARLAAELGLRARSRADQAARYARLGLVDEARAVYAELAAGLGPERTHVELTRRQAQLAAQAGDQAEARRLEAAAEAARSPRHPVRAVFGRVIELSGYDVTPRRLHGGEPLELTYHWRLLAPGTDAFMTYVHIRPEGGGRSRFGDDHRLPALVDGLGETLQRVVERRQLPVPPDVEPGHYRIVLGVRDPASGERLRRWWHGLVPTPSQTVELATIEILPHP